MGKYVDFYYADNRLMTLVNKILKCNYGWILARDYDDYYSIAGTTLWYCEEHYDENRNNNFNNYLIDSLHRKFKSQITYRNRQKRGGGLEEVSLDQPIDCEEDITIGDMLVGDDGDFEIDGDCSILTDRYLKSLTPMQKKVAELFMQGCNEQDIKEILGLSNDRYNLIVMNMCEDKKLTPLKKLRKMRGV